MIFDHPVEKIEYLCILNKGAIKGSSKRGLANLFAIEDLFGAIQDLLSEPSWSVPFRLFYFFFTSTALFADILKIQYI